MCLICELLYVRITIYDISLRESQIARVTSESQEKYDTINSIVTAFCPDAKLLVFQTTDINNRKDVSITSY